MIKNKFPLNKFFLQILAIFLVYFLFNHCYYYYFPLESEILAFRETLIIFLVCVK